MKIKYKERLDRVCDYIQYSLNSKLNLDCLANVAALSKFHFHRQFSAYTGRTVTEYVHLMRMKRASYKLAFSEDKIIDIALDANFETPESFSRSFKRLFGQTPRSFRIQADWSNWHKKLEISLPKKGNITMNIKLVDVAEEKIAFIDHKGSPDLIKETAVKFIAWRKETGLSPVKTSNTYGIAYSDPETTPVEEFRFDICGSVTTAVPENTYGIKTATIPAGKCACVRHKGSHDGLRDKIISLYCEWLPSTDFSTREFPLYFQYHNFIHEVDECDLITDIYLPIK